MDIYEIKKRTKKTSPLFFSEDTLRFFGQKMSDFKVIKKGDKYLIKAPSYKNGELMGYTKRLFNPETNELERVEC